MKLIEFWLNPVQISILKSALGAAGVAAFPSKRQPTPRLHPATHDSVQTLLNHARRVDFNSASLKN